MTDVDRLAAAAQAKGITVAVAESLTSGLLASTIGAGEGAGEWFAGGVVAYRTSIKESVLGVPTGLDPYSTLVAEHLASGVRRLLGADIAVATTGVGGPDPESGHAPGTVFVGWCTSAGAGHRRLALEGGPEEVLEQAVAHAVATLADLAEEL